MTTLCIDELSKQLKGRWGWAAGADHVPRPARPQLWSVRIDTSHVYTADSIPHRGRDVCRLSSIPDPVRFHVQLDAMPGGGGDTDCAAVDVRTR